MSFHPAGGPPPPGAPQPPSHPRDYNPTTPDEKAYYDQLFTIADTAATGQLQGLHAVNFFKLSGLDVGILKNVWTVADARQQHYLTREDFYVALRLIAMAQNNIPPTREKLHETAAIQLPYARFQNVPPPPASTPPPPPSPPQALLSPSRSGQDPYAMSGEDRARYLNHFAPYDTNGDGFVEGPQAVELFSRSGLDRQALGKQTNISSSSSSSSSNSNDLTGVVNDTQALAQKLKAEKISLSATLDSNLADGKRTQAALVKALGEVTSLQGELAALRQAAAAADEEQQQALQNLGGARKQREMLLMEVEKMRGEVERLQQRERDLSEELAGLRVQQQRQQHQEEEE
eukprot:evm.model.NODE_8501_length_17168_cov_60.054344.1